MAETLGSLIDKLSIVKLKEFHTEAENTERLSSLAVNEKRLVNEIDAFVNSALSGKMPVEEITFSANKVYKKDGNDLRADLTEGGLGELAGKLCSINCELWHVQEHVYEFEKIPPAEKDGVIKQLAVLNLERNVCIDRIDSVLKETVLKQRNG